MVQESALGPIIDRIQSAARDPSQWSRAVAGIAEICGGHCGVLYEHDRVRHASAMIAAPGIDPGLIQAYEQHYHALDPWNRPATCASMHEVQRTHELMPDAEFRRSEFYQDHSRRADIFYSMGIVVDRSADSMAIFGVQCGHRKGPFTDQAAGIVKHLMPHLRQAYLTQRAMRTVAQMCTTLTETLHLVPSPVLVVDGAARLGFANHSAEALLRSGDGLRLSRGMVTPANRDQVTPFNKMLAALARGTSGAKPPTHDIAVQRAAGGRPLLLRFAVLPQGERRDGPRIAIFVDLASGLARNIDRLQQSLGLTKAEARLLEGLVAGESLAALSEKHRVSVNTLRVHLSRLFQKTGTHRQAELVRFALTAGGIEREGG
jgi:DNA-binding CsgD family transcriptional regulator